MTNHNTYGEDEFPEDPEEFPDDRELPEDLRGWEEISPAAVEHWRKLGYSQSAIGRRYGFTRQYISWIKQYHGGTLTKRQEVLQHWPFVVPAEQGQCAPYKRLRDHAEYFVTGGLGMAEDRLSRLRGFYNKLREDDLVVEYDPAIAPTPGVSNKGGWAYRKRRKADEDLLIRVNEHTFMTDKAFMIWRFPPLDP